MFIYLFIIFVKWDLQNSYYSYQQKKGGKYEHQETIKFPTSFFHFTSNKKWLFLFNKLNYS